ncbi:MAG TPA: hypothetical protein DCE76_09395 [Anaerolineaceae bacterium]|nr:hypothetical protein [Anaerolineaceae bacterium]
MNILLLVPHYEPDLGPSAPLFTLLSEELIKRGHHVRVLTTVPHYPSGIVPPAFRKKWIQQSVEMGVEIYRIRVPSLNRSNLAGRLLQFFVYQVGAGWQGLFLNYEVVFVANPALWVWLPFFILVFLRRKPAVFSIYDLYPDVGVRLGIFRNPVAFHLVKALEKFCLKHSARVRIISESFRSAIHQFGIPDQKIQMIPDWVDSQFIRPLPRQNPFSKEYCLENHFVIQYAGNMGFSQPLEIILDAARAFASDPDILFTLVGDGCKREKLMQLAAEQNLRNVRFIPYQPRERLPHVLASADVALVILKEGMAYTAMPSKILSILAAGRPIIACVDRESETWKFIQKTEAGVCVPAGNTNDFIQAILTLRANPLLCKRMSRNGRNWILRHHTPQIAAEKMESLFLSMLPRPRHTSRLSTNVQSKPPHSEP